MEPNGMELNGREELLNPTPQPKLGLATFNGSAIYGTYDVKWSEEGKGMEKWRKILVIAEGKMSLSRDAESR